MGNVMNKIWNMFNMNQGEEPSDVETVDAIIDMDDPEDVDGEVRGLFGRRSNKSNIQQSVKMVVIQPSTFEQSVEICDMLRERKSIIINLEYVNKDVARRVIDVISGAVRVLDGQMQKISNSIFLIAPFNYDIDSTLKDEPKYKFKI